MKKSTFNLQTIVLASVLSAALFFGVVSSLYVYHTQMADARKTTINTEVAVAAKIQHPIILRIQEQMQ